MKRAISLIAAIALLGAAGCGSQDAQMSAADRANFAGGGPKSVRSPEQQRAMNDFITQFNKAHPHAAGPPNAPPQGQPPK